MPAYRSGRGSARAPVLALFAANLALSLAWTLIFQRWGPVLAGVEIVVLLATIVALVRLTWPYDRIAALALAPYAAWVSFASILTWWIALSN